ncbi:trypsin-like peptidase domain-containing protein [Micromonospora sp. WMMD1102]|uniref:trypsin-like peptidase domain-containing protein n=1 Tax=Micromonospora sp. WMMD1102 TaxID=3016105 RepID=UPI002414DBF1|nr:trypsin-like peptidase domain-containing protein [Micromonospora sp. WMMD1102]MDG4788636.1 trypsin-like peptidase domain-containing protein [Micromonospora sp. WMMD1102]
MIAGQGCDPAAIAEVIVTRADGGQWRASGYRVTTTALLTAAHAVADAQRIVLRFDAGQESQWTVDAEPGWCDPESDIALLRFTPPEQAPDTATVSYGGFARDASAVVDVHTAGFPLWKRRTGPSGSRYRDLHDASGRLAVLSNRRDGTAEITVAPPAEPADRTTSPWQGMSGAAVWAGNHLVGVVVEHHLPEGAGRLTATRLDRCLGRADDTRRDELCRLLGLAGPLDLADVTPAPAGWRTRSGYLEQVRDIAPVAGLYERTAELAELAAFCAGDEAYVHWQAGPWAGKTALMSTFVLDPPAGVDVVSFFVTARLAAQSDSSAFVDAILDQLSALLGEALPAAMTTLRARDAHRRALLREAAARCAAAGRRLVLVIDGLDEDRGSVPGSGLASIASLLPKFVEDGLRVVVSSRPSPEIPSDVPADHPLRSCARRMLEVSPYATETARLAQRELDELLNGGQTHRDVIGLVAASGGGLSLPELEELCDQPRYVIEGMLSGVFGRTIAARLDHSTLEPKRAFLFAHETLRVKALDRIGPQRLGGYRDRIHRWAESYQALGWPPDTPPYLLRGYPRLVHETADCPRLLALAVDPARHDRMLDLTGGDAAALAEIKTAQDLTLAQPRLDLTAMARLAMRREDLLARNADIPVGLPALWAALGQPARAEALAYGIDQAYRQVEALTELAVTLAGQGDRDRAAALVDAVQTVAETIADPRQQELASACAARACAAIGDASRAAAALRTITDPELRAGTAVELAIIWYAHGRPAEADACTDAAHAATGQITSDDPRALMLCRLARAGAHGDRAGAATAIDRAGIAAGRIADPDLRVQALAQLGRAAALTGDRHRARALVVEAETAARSSVPSSPRLTEMAVEAAGTDYAWTEAILESLTDPAEQVRARLVVSRAVSATHPSRARELLERAGGIAERRPWLVPWEVLGDLALALASVGQRGRAELVANAIDGDSWRSMTFARLSLGFAARGDYAAAEEIADRVGEPRRRAVTLAQLAMAAARAGDRAWSETLADRAEATVRATADTRTREFVFADLERARRLVEAGGGTGTPAGDRPAASTQPPPAGTQAPVAVPGILPESPVALVRAAAEAGDLDRTTALAERIADPVGRSSALAEVARAQVVAGNHADVWQSIDAALVLARRERDVAAQAAMVARLARVAAGTGDHRRALGIARESYFELRQTPMLDDLAGAMIAVGETARAETLSWCVDDPGRRAAILAELAGAVTATHGAGHGAELFASAERIAGGIRDRRERAGRLTEVALTLVDTGEHDRASRLANAAEESARNLYDPHRQAVTLLDLADALTGAGQLDTALALVGTAEAVSRGPTDLQSQSMLLSRIALALARAGRADAAVSAARQVADPVRQPQVIAEVVAVLARGADHELAEDLARTIRDDASRHQALHDLALGVADHAPERAERIADEIGAPGLRLRALAGLASAALDRRDRPRADALFAKADRLIDTAGSGEFEWVDRAQLAKALVAADELERAAKVASGIRDEHWQAIVLARLALRQVVLGDDERAQETVAGITDPTRRATALLRVARTAAQQGRTEWAGRLVRSAEAMCPDHVGANLRSMYLGELARALHAVDEPTEATKIQAHAEALAHGITDRGQRAWALTDLARAALARSGSDPHAGQTGRRLLALALSVGSWAAPLRVLVETDPTALLAIAELATKVASRYLPSGGTGAG